VAHFPLSELMQDMVLEVMKHLSTRDAIHLQRTSKHFRAAYLKSRHPFDSNCTNQMFRYLKIMTSQRWGSELIFNKLLEPYLKLLGRFTDDHSSFKISILRNVVVSINIHEFALLINCTSSFFDSEKYEIKGITFDGSNLNRELTSSIEKSIQNINDLIRERKGDLWSLTIKEPSPRPRTEEEQRKWDEYLERKLQTSRF
jgi:hypothetical protein